MQEESRNLSNKHSSKKESDVVYGLIFREENKHKIYIGMTSDISERFKQHSKNGKKTKALKSYILFYKGGSVEEHFLTLALGCELGYSVVEGSNYCSKGHKDLKFAVLGTFNACFQCEQLDHMSTNPDECPKPNPDKKVKWKEGYSLEELEILMAYIVKKYALFTQLLSKSFPFQMC